MSRIFCYWVVAIFCWNGSIIPVFEARAGEKIFFETADGESFWCDRDHLEYHMDEDGNLSSICHLSFEDAVMDGKTKETAFQLNVNGRIFKKYILDLIRYGEVSFKNTADAENALRICENLGLPNAENYILKVLKRKPREIDNLSGLGGARGTVEDSDLNCPEGYIPVPGNQEYATPNPGSSFCVMRYEASHNISSVVSWQNQAETHRALSQPGALPWVSISREQAELACQELGSGYHLMTNSEWMTIARNIEANPENWSGHEVGTGNLSVGNCDSGAAAAPIEGQPYLGTRYFDDGVHKRTHHLSNGEVIWDISGNVWEWVSDNLTTPRASAQDYWNPNHFFPGTLYPAPFAPAGRYPLPVGVGRIYMWDGGAVIRGGAWHSREFAGVFAANLDIREFQRADDIGFRCAYSP